MPLQVFGRRAAMLGALGLFALGSALCGSAQNMSWLIAARSASCISLDLRTILIGTAAIQGAGGGAIQSVSSIVVSDLVPLKDRGAYNALIGG